MKSSMNLIRLMDMAKYRDVSKDWLKLTSKQQHFALLLLEDKKVGGSFSYNVTKLKQNIKTNEVNLNNNMYRFYDYYIINNTFKLEPELVSRRYISILIKKYNIDSVIGYKNYNGVQLREKINIDSFKNILMNIIDKEK